MNNEQLRDILADTLKELKDGKIQASDARVRSDVAQTILNSVKLDLDAQRLAQKTGTHLPFFETGTLIEGESDDDKQDQKPSLASVPKPEKNIVPSQLRGNNRTITFEGNRMVHTVK